MQVRLEISHPKANVRRVVLRCDAVIGRSSDCNLRIASNQVSRKHCKITLADTAVLVRDLGSSNGTYVDGEQLAPNEDVALSPGTILSVGGVKFVVRFDAPQPAPGSPGSTVELPGLGETLSDEEAQTEAQPPDAQPTTAATTDTVDQLSLDDETVPETAEVPETADEMVVAESGTRRPAESIIVAGDPDAADDFQEQNLAILGNEADAPEALDPARAASEPVIEESLSEEPEAEEVYAEPAADQFDFAEAEAAEESEYAEAQAAEESEYEQEYQQAVEVPEKKSKLRSLFGLFGRRGEPVQQEPVQEQEEVHAETAAAEEQVEYPQATDEQVEYDYEDADEAVSAALDEQTAEVSDEDVAEFLPEPETGEQDQAGDQDDSLGDFLSQFDND